MLKRFLVTLFATAFLSSSQAATVVLQQSLNGYSGCTDKSLIKTLGGKPDNSDNTIFTIEG